MPLFRKTPPVWFVLRPGRAGEQWKQEGAYTRATIGQMHANGQLGGGALLWTNEKIFANPKKPNSGRMVRIEKWARFDELPDPTQNAILAAAQTEPQPAPAETGAGAGTAPWANAGAPETHEDSRPPPPPPRGGYAGGGGGVVQLKAEYPGQPYAAQAQQPPAAGQYPPQAPAGHYAPQAAAQPYPQAAAQAYPQALPPPQQYPQQHAQQYQPPAPSAPAGYPPQAAHPAYPLPAQGGNLPPPPSGPHPGPM